MALGKLPDSSGGDDDDGAIFAEINITPLTDVFLVMVIIFMLSSLAVQVQHQEEKKKTQQQEEKADTEKKSGIKVNLPSGAAQELDTKAASLVLEVAVNGDVVVAGKALKDTDLDNLFRAAFARDKQTQVVLKADKAVAHGRVVGLMERAKAAGLTHLAIGTAGG